MWKVFQDRHLDFFNKSQRRHERENGIQRLRVLGNMSVNLDVYTIYSDFKNTATTVEH